MRIAVPTRGKRKLTNRLAETFSRAPSFTIVTIEDGQIKSVELLNNPGEASERGAGPLAAKFLKENDVDLLLTGEMGPGARNILEALNIGFELVEQGGTVKDIVAPYTKLATVRD
jgi:predicted Fe-Mo cluster-binding NifX family protein